MAAVSQTTHSDAFSWMKMLEFRLRFHWSLFQRAQLTIFQHWFRWWRGAGQATSHYLNQLWLVYWRIYASLGLNELIDSPLLKKAGTYFNVNIMPISYVISFIPNTYLVSLLTDCALMMPNVDIDLRQHWLRSYGIKPLLEPMLTYQQWVGPEACTSEQFPRNEHDINLQDECKHYSFKLTTKSPSGQWVNQMYFVNQRYSRFSHFPMPFVHRRILLLVYV